MCIQYPSFCYFKYIVFRIYSVAERVSCLRSKVYLLKYWVRRVKGIKGLFNYLKETYYFYILEKTKYNFSFYGILYNISSYLAIDKHGMARGI